VKPTSSSTRWAAASRLPAWLADAGARRMHEESERSGFLYYTRFFRGTWPRLLAPLLTAIGTVSLLTLPGEATRGR
jgi:hypothetical protein